MKINVNQKHELQNREETIYKYDDITDNNEPIQEIISDSTEDVIREEPIYKYESVQEISDSTEDVIREVKNELENHEEITEVSDEQTQEPIYYSLKNIKHMVLPFLLKHPSVLTFDNCPQTITIKDVRLQLKAIQNKGLF